MSNEERIVKYHARHRAAKRYSGLFGFADGQGEAIFVLGFGAALFAASVRAKHLIDNHPAFFIASNGLALSHQGRNRALVNRINSVIFSNHPQYLRIDNGCDEKMITGIITPFTAPNSSGIRSKTETVLFRVIIDHFPLPCLQPLRNSHGLTARQIDILKPFCERFSVQDAGSTIGVTPQRAREMFCEIYARLRLSSKSELIAFLGRLPVEPETYR